MAVVKWNFYKNVIKQNTAHQQNTC